MTWLRGYKTFFMLNSTEHEILTAHKMQNGEKYDFSKLSDFVFILLINVKMPTIVGIYPQIKARKGKLFSYFSTKTYVVGTQKSRLTYMFKLMDKKIIAILR